MSDKIFVDSCNCEMGYEYLSTIPWAYSLHKKGLLEGTRSGVGSEAFYFFSPRHEINPAKRDWANTKDCRAPNIYIHKPSLIEGEWEAVPYKGHYGPQAITFDKPTVIIYNRYTKEWGRNPINFFDLDTLRKLFTMLTPKYEIVYFNLRGRKELEDNSESLYFGDFDMIRTEFPQVRIFHDLVQEHGGDYNRVQLRVMAGCKRFVSMNGAPSMMCSSFGGENIIYTKECREIKPRVNSFYNIYPRFGSANIKVVHSYDDLLALVRSKWVAEDPLINILVRCHRRPGGLARLYESLKGQSYINWRVIASYDDERTWDYLIPYPFEKIKVTPITDLPPKPERDDYKRPLPANLYFNEMVDLVEDGFVMHLDDDDTLRERNGLQLIAQNLDKYKLTLWRAGILGRPELKIPSDETFGQIIAGRISGIAFAYHVNHKHLAQWEPWRRGDYRVIRSLADKLQPIWVDHILTLIGKDMPAPPVKQRKKPLLTEAEKEAKRADMAKSAAEMAEKMEAARTRNMQPVAMRVCHCCGQPLK